MKVNDKIKVMRIFRGMKQSDMAEKMGYNSDKSYQLLEKGEIELTIEKIERIAEILNVSLQDLLGLNEGNVINIAGNCHYNSQNLNHYSSQHLTLLTETQCAQELEKTRLLLQERNKEVELLKQKINDLNEIICLLKEKLSS